MGSNDTRMRRATSSGRSSAVNSTSGVAWMRQLERVERFDRMDSVRRHDDDVQTRR